MGKKTTIILMVFSFLIISGCVWAVSRSPDSNNIAPYVENELLVKFKESANIRNEVDAKNKIEQIYTRSRVVEAEQLIKQTKDDSLGITRIYKIKLEDGGNIIDAISKLNKNKQIEYAEPNYLLELAFTPNDPDLWRQYFLNNIGQCYMYRLIPPFDCIGQGTYDADIDGPEAWDIQTGNNIIAAVVDSGLAISNPEIQENVWQNYAEINGLPNRDDDFNGHIDDFNGWNFVNDNNNLQDNYVHGTAIAGILAAKSNNGMGVSSVCHGCKIMPIKVTDNSNFPMSTVIPGINYAIENVAQIISMSFYTSTPSDAFRDIIVTAHNNGIIMVAAAGNTNTNTSKYPAAYPQVIGVAGTTAQDIRWSISSYGTWVDISAPAYGVYTIGRIPLENGYYDGTSYATPIVAGVAGLILSKNPTLTKAQVEQIILNNADPMPNEPLYVNGLMGSGRVNAHRALLATPRFGGGGGSPLFLKAERVVIDR